jgi:uncharacterized lipoprotein YajG
MDSLKWQYAKCYQHDERKIMRVHDVAGVSTLLLCAALAGCATTRSEVKLGGPEPAPAAAAVTKARAVFIRAVTDERIFQQAPSDPSIPSLGFEGADKASAEIKARAIGRKRGGFGQAMGDVLLENGQTVTEVLKENLAAGLRDAGYRVANNTADAGQSPIIMDVRIKQFWAWFRPGFWAITLSTNIMTSLEVQGMSAPTDVSVHAENSGMAATESAWIEIVNKALKEYRGQVVAKAASLP